MSSESASFSGLHVAAFESRRAEEMARIIERFDGVPHVSPSMREVPRDENPEAIDFANRLMTGQIDLVILLTGVGTRHLISQVQRHVDRQRFLSALSDITTVVRGPKPAAALREVGLTPTCVAPEPNTWREVLHALDVHCPVANLVVALQEYGEPNPSLIAGLEARGATVINLRVYDWDLPEDTGPLEENVRAIAAGELDVVLFTSANQINNMSKCAEGLDLSDQVRRSLRNLVLASIGPTTSMRLRDYDLPVDVQPEHPKMGHLVQAAASRAREILSRKRQMAVKLSQATPGTIAKERPPWYDSPFMKACRLEPSPMTPVWLMRQAGRYLPEYREVRTKTSFMELYRNPQLASQVMVSAVERLSVDAAIVFADLLPILEPMGMQLEFAQGEGPVIHNPVREPGDVDRLIELESIDALHFVTDAVRQTRADLPDTIPLIGFAGAPFTLASYAIEGGASRNYLHTKTLMYRDLQAWNALMGRLVRAIALYLKAQITSGAQAVQLFDSWIGCLGVDDYRRFVLPHVQAVIGAMPAGVPVIHFGTGNPALIPHMAEAGGGVLGVDWRVSLDSAWQQVGYHRAIQGNLDPMVLLAEPREIRRRTELILQQAAGRPGHIFNLGHGVLPQTPVENVINLVEAVHELSQR